MRRIMFVGAHQDDMQGAAAGLFAKMQKHFAFAGLEVTLTNGAGGHQLAKYLKDPEALKQRRFAEAAAAAKMVGFQYQVLKDVDGNDFPDSDLQITRASKGAVWAAIRQFQPEVLVTLPVNNVADSYGMHNDHTNVGEIVKRIAYLIAAPLAFPEYYSPEDRNSLEDQTELPYVRPPVIITCHDGYSGQIDPDLIIDITDELDTKARAFAQHESQVNEWLPWVGRYPAPSFEELKALLSQRSHSLAKRFALPSGTYEAFTITSWGSMPTLDNIRSWFPGDALGYERAAAKLDRLS